MVEDLLDQDRHRHLAERGGNRHDEGECDPDLQLGADGQPATQHGDRSGVGQVTKEEVVVLEDRVVLVGHRGTPSGTASSASHSSAVSSSSTS